MSVIAARADQLQEGLDDVDRHVAKIDGDDEEAKASHRPPVLSVPVENLEVAMTNMLARCWL